MHIYVCQQRRKQQQYNCKNALQYLLFKLKTIHDGKSAYHNCVEPLQQAPHKSTETTTNFLHNAHTQPTGIPARERVKREAVNAHTTRYCLLYKGKQEIPQEQHKAKPDICTRVSGLLIAYNSYASGAYILPWHNGGKGVGSGSRTRIKMGRMGAECLMPSGEEAKYRRTSNSSVREPRTKLPVNPLVIQSTTPGSIYEKINNSTGKSLSVPWCVISGDDVDRHLRLIFLENVKYSGLRRSKFG